jgi:hypothetical protein
MGIPRHLVSLLSYSTGAFVIWGIKGFKRGGLKKEMEIYELNAQFWSYSVIGFIVLFGLLKLAFHIYEISTESELERLLREYKETH